MLRLASEGFLSASTNNFLEGIQPILMQVPPYIELLFSTNITSSPCFAKSAAKVFPAFPKPIIKFFMFIFSIIVIFKIKR